MPPPAATVNVRRRILNANGRGVSNAQIYLIDQNGAVRITRTNPFGFYRFADVPSGETYIINVSHKLYTFAPRALSVMEEISELNFVVEAPF